jgi:succinyl-diaminopimelate desuccinylase
VEGVDWLVVGEPTSLDVVVAHRGALWLEVVAHGRTAHGSMPHLGVNAIDGLLDLLHALRDLRIDYTPHALLAPPTMNVGTIRGGIKTNVVPDFASATVDLRTLPGQRHEELVDAALSIASTVEESRPGLRLEVRVAHDLPAVETDPKQPLVQAAERVTASVRGQAPLVKGVSYYTDASVLTPPSGVPTLIFGPGDETLCHQPNERIEVKQVLLAVRCYTALAQELLGK